jgi:hypothetical protein
VPVAQALADFQTNVAQCDSLIANAHKTDPSSLPILPVLDQQQITVAAFLNLFIAWETFIEVTLHELMTGSPTLSRTMPTKYVSPVNQQAARAFVIGPRLGAYFDYGNHNLVKPLVRMYFQNGYPYEPHFSSIEQDLADIRTMRNAAAHITSSTQTALDSLAARVLRKRVLGISLYDLLMSTDPTSAANTTIFATYRDKLLVAAELIAKG